MRPSSSMEPLQGSILAILFSVLLFSTATGLHAHGLNTSVSRGIGAVVLQISYENGEPFAYEEYEVFAPVDASTGKGHSKSGQDGEAEAGNTGEHAPVPVQVGNTDHRGRIVFMADTPGKWMVRYVSHDGHGGTKTITIREDGSHASVGGSPLTRFAGPVTGVGIFLGLFGVASLFYCKRGNQNDENRTDS